MTIETNKSIVLSVSEKGALCAVNGTNTLVPWSTLRDAADPQEQGDVDLLPFYHALLAQANKMAKRERPLYIYGAEINTNVYGVVGLAVNGRVHSIRGFSCGLRLNADEGLDLFRLTHAREEAAEIAKRNGLQCRTGK